MYLCIQGGFDRQDPLQESFAILAHPTDLEVEFFFSILIFFYLQPDLKSMRLDRGLTYGSPLLRLKPHIFRGYVFLFSMFEPVIPRNIRDMLFQRLNIKQWITSIEIMSYHLIFF